MFPYLALLNLPYFGISLFELLFEIWGVPKDTPITPILSSKMDCKNHNIKNKNKFILEQIKMRQM